MRRLKLGIASVLFLGFMIIVLPHEARQLEEVVGHSDSPDTSLFYSASSLKAMASDYGEEGREAYIISRLRFDIAWPLVYGFFFYTLLSLLGGVPWVRALPWIAVGFDLLENTIVSWVFWAYPSDVFLAPMAGFMTLFKWLSLGLSIAFIVGLTIGKHQQTKGGLR